MTEGVEDKGEFPTAGTANFDGQMLIEVSEEEALIPPQESDPVRRLKTTTLEAHCSVIASTIPEIKSINEKNSILTGKDEKIFSYSRGDPDSRAFNGDPIIEPQEIVSNLEKYYCSTKNTNEKTSISGTYLVPFESSQNNWERERLYDHNVISEGAGNQLSEINPSDLYIEILQDLFEHNFDNNIKKSNISEHLEAQLNSHNEKMRKHGQISYFNNQECAVNCHETNDACYPSNQQKESDNSLTSTKLTVNSLGPKNQMNLCFEKCNAEQFPTISELTQAETCEFNDEITSSNKSLIDCSKIRRVFERMLLRLSLEESMNQTNSDGILEILLNRNTTQNNTKASRASILEEINSNELDVEKSLKLFKRISNITKHIPNHGFAYLQQILLNNLIENVEAVSNFATDLL